MAIIFPRRTAKTLTIDCKGMCKNMGISGKKFFSDYVLFFLRGTDTVLFILMNMKSPGELIPFDAPKVSFASTGQGV